MVWCTRQSHYEVIGLDVSMNESRIVHAFYPLKLFNVNIHINTYNLVYYLQNSGQRELGTIVFKELGQAGTQELHHENVLVVFLAEPVEFGKPLYIHL